MAIYRLHIKVGKAGKAGPHAAYIARLDKYADRLDRGERLEATEVGGMPAWAAHNPLVFWRAADAHERVNGSTYREMEIALPRELSPEQRIELVRSWVAQEIGDRHAYQWAIHVPVATDGGEQPHVHLMFSERQRDGIERDPEQYFRRYNAKNPEKGGARKGWGEVEIEKGPARTAARAVELMALRGRWADTCNAALGLAGVAARIDHRTNAERDMPTPPEPKLPPGVWRREPGQAREVTDLRALRAELEATGRAVVREMPEGPVPVIEFERRAAAKRERERIEAMSSAELSAEIIRVRPRPTPEVAKQDPVVIKARRATEVAHKAQQEAAEAKREAEAWRQANPRKAMAMRLGLWRWKHVEDWDAQAAQLPSLEVAYDQVTVAERQTWMATLERVEGEQIPALQRVIELEQRREVVAERERRERQAEQARQEHARQLAADLVAATELQRQGALPPDPVLERWTRSVNALGGPPWQKEGMLAEEILCSSRMAEGIAQALEPHRRAIEREHSRGMGHGR